MNKPSDNLIVSMVGFLRAFVFQHKVLKMRHPSLSWVCVLDGPWSLQAARRANCNWVLHRRPPPPPAWSHLPASLPTNATGARTPAWFSLSVTVFVFAFCNFSWWKSQHFLCAFHPPTCQPGACPLTKQLLPQTPQKQFLLPSHNIWWKPPYFLFVS